MIIEGIEFDMTWIEDTSPRGALPSDCGIYCEVHWPVRGIRIGVSENIRRRHGGHASWLRGMKKGVSLRSKRLGPLPDYAKVWGDLGLETFVLSTDPRLQDVALQFRCEKALHKWAENQSEWKNFNKEHWTPKNFGEPVLDEVKEARAWKAELKRTRR